LKISIITVCYNSAKTIERTFQSVRKQTYSNIEYIVIDGNSIDNTLKIIENYKDIITKVISEPDKGLYDAMNKGIKLAKGDIIGILNSDDVFYSNKTLEEVAFFTKKNQYKRL
jgi:glycosyltransferase involved in cell wall biosynthesis